MHRHAVGVLWVLAYVLVVSSPLLFMAVRPVPPARPFLLEASVTLGFVAILMMAIQFVLIGRFQSMSAPFGIDVLLRYHRHIAAIALAFVVFHSLMLVLHDPALVAWYDPIGGTWASRTGAWALYAFILLTLLSIFRQQLRLGYEAWRMSHTILGIAALASAVVHVHLAGRYISTAWKEWLIVGICGAMVGAYAYIRLVRPALLRRAPYRVTEVRPERGSVWSLALQADGHPGMRFLPGQYGYLRLASPYSLDEHPFSFSSSSQDRGRLEFAIKELGDFTNRIGEVPPGTTAFVDGPHGSFSTDLTPAPGYVFIAGGIGIAPFMSLLRTLADRGDPRPVLLVYGEKRWDDVAFRDELDRLRERIALDVVYVLEQPHEGWEGETGFVTEAILRRHLPSESFERHVFICGPNPMIDAVERALVACGVPERNVTAERFALV
ncbi:MAG: ferric reductase-like transmembrane domain-containing protein [Trueperaceae bacterium]